MTLIRYTVTISTRALRQLEAACAYINAQGAPGAAQVTGARLFAAIDELEIHPHRGRVAGRDLRELVTVRPYVIRYRIRGSAVQVVRIRHGAQKPD